MNARLSETALIAVWIPLTAVLLMGNPCRVKRIYDIFNGGGDEDGIFPPGQFRDRYGDLSPAIVEDLFDGPVTLGINALLSVGITYTQIRIDRAWALPAAYAV